MSADHDDPDFDADEDAGRDDDPGPDMDRDDDKEPDTLTRALKYGRAGWPVFPLRPDTKLPLFRAAHAPNDPRRSACRGESDCGRLGHGFKDATTDPERIVSWFAGTSNNVGVATGRDPQNPAKRGPDVLDVDHKSEQQSGFAALNRIRRAGLVPPPQAIVRTPSGGMHLYYKGSTEPQGCGSLEKHHIDFRSLGGYVVAPPSKVRGVSYDIAKIDPQAASSVIDFSRIRDHLEPRRQLRADVPRGELRADPDALAAHLIRDWQSRIVPCQTGCSPGCERHNPLGRGNKNKSLFYAANRVIEAGGPDTAAGLKKLADAARATGLTPKAIDNAIKSALRTSSGDRRPFEREAG